MKAKACLVLLPLLLAQPAASQSPSCLELTEPPFEGAMRNSGVAYEDMQSDLALKVCQAEARALLASGEESDSIKTRVKWVTLGYARALVSKGQYDKAREAFAVLQREDFPPALLEEGLLLLYVPEYRQDTKPIDAVRLISIASGYDYDPATNELGTLYLNGHFLATNSQQAHKLFAQAAPSYDMAKVNLIRMYPYLTRQEQYRINGLYADYKRTWRSHEAIYRYAETKLAHIMNGVSELRFNRNNYLRAKEMFGYVAKHAQGPLAERARANRDELAQKQIRFMNDWEKRKHDQEMAAWAGLIAGSIALLSLLDASPSSPAKTYDSCTGLDGLGWYGSSYGQAVAFFGCKRY